MEKEFNLYKEILDQLHEGIYFVDKDRNIIFWNKEAERITGFKSEEIIGSHCYDHNLKHVDHNCKQLCQDACPIQETLMDGKRRDASVYLQHKNGHRVAVAIKTIPLDVDGELIGVAQVFVDNDKQFEINKEVDALKTLALYDQLTALPNRRYIDSVFANTLREFEELGIPFAVAMMDLDHFKNVNDTYGHDVGDLILQMVAKTLKNNCKKTDLIGRWGGEEFLFILTGVSEKELKSVLERMRQSVESSVLENGSHPISVTISIGATLVRKDDTASIISKRVDYAMYQSKENGRNRVTIL